MLKTLTYYGHSCFRITAENGWTAVFDPYREQSVPGLHLPALKADAVFCSHEHADHNGSECVSRKTPVSANPYEVELISTDHDDQGGKLRGKNNVMILFGDDEKIVHMGDIGCIPSEEVLNALKYADILMIPCGGYYTIDAKQARELIGMLEPKLAVLMHFRSGSRGYDVIASEADVCRDIPEAVPVKECSIGLDTYRGVIIMEPHPDTL